MSIVQAHKRRAQLIVMPRPSEVPVGRVVFLEHIAKLSKIDRQIQAELVGLQRMLDEMDAEAGNG